MFSPEPFFVLSRMMSAEKNIYLHFTLLKSGLHQRKVLFSIVSAKYFKPESEEVKIVKLDF